MYPSLQQENYSHCTHGKWRLTRSPIQGSFGPSQGQEASFLQVLCGQVAGDSGCPHTLLPHHVTVFKKRWGIGQKKKNIYIYIYILGFHVKRRTQKASSTHTTCTTGSLQSLLVNHSIIYREEPRRQTQLTLPVLQGPSRAYWSTTVSFTEKNPEGKLNSHCLYYRDPPDPAVYHSI